MFSAHLVQDCQAIQAVRVLDAPSVGPRIGLCHREHGAQMDDQAVVCYPALAGRRAHRAEAPEQEGGDERPRCPALAAVRQERMKGRTWRPCRKVVKKPIEAGFFEFHNESNFTEAEPTRSFAD